MKSYLILANLLFFSFLTNAQVQIKSLPSFGYEKRITEFIEDLAVVDTHEHLLSPEKLKQRTSLDFMLLLHHYAVNDFTSAGMSGHDLKKLFKDSLSIIEKWQLLKPYWESSSNTSFNRVALLSADKLFNTKDINESTVTELSKKIEKAYQTKGWIKNVVSKSKIAFLIQDDLDSDDRSFGDERFRYVKRFDNFIDIDSKKSIISIAKQQNTTIQTLDDLEGALDAKFNEVKEQGIVAVKTALAYKRALNFENVSKERAQDVFNTLMNTPEEGLLSFSYVKPLQDYMMHRVLERAKAYNIPVAIHTGMLSGRTNIDNTNPTHLINLFFEFPEVNFVLFHGSYPFGGELSTIAKSFRNVYIDMCWLYVISPTYSERYLHEWLETIPASKIMAFGGDYRNIENVYGHLLLAKQIISKVLIDKVKDGYFSEYEAINIARMILYDNAVNFYKLAQ